MLGFSVFTFELLCRLGLGLGYWGDSPKGWGEDPTDSSVTVAKVRLLEQDWSTFVKKNFLRCSLRKQKVQLQFLVLSPKNTGWVLATPFCVILSNKHGHKEAPPESSAKSWYWWISNKRNNFAYLHNYLHRIKILTLLYLLFYIML